MSSEHTRIDCQSNDNVGLLTIQILAMILCLFGLMITILISIHAVKKIPTVQNLNNTIKYLFYGSLICCFSILLLYILQTSICLATPSISSDSHQYYFTYQLTWCFFILMYSIFTLLLLAMLLFRLENCFAGSVFKLTRLQKLTLISLLTLIVILYLMNITIYFVVAMKWDGDWSIAQSSHPAVTSAYGVCGIILFMVTSVYALFLFTKKLINLAIMQKRSTRNVSYELSLSQKKLIDGASKYVSILSVAIFTTILTSVVWLLDTVLWDNSSGYRDTIHNSYLGAIFGLFTA
eukprot:325275_1